jgi:hypothetical protein
MTTECVKWISDEIRAGLPIRLISEIFERKYKQEICERLERFWTDYRFARNVGKITQTVPSPDELYQDLKGQIPTRHVINDIVVANFGRFEQLISKQFSSTKAKWISCDHTFKTAANIGYQRDADKKWIKQYKAVFCILNEKGQVLQWQFTSSEGFDEVRPMFENLKERFENMGTKLSGIFVDNCCKWRDSLSQIFPDIPVKLDLFHAVQRVVRELPKRSKFCKDFGNEFGLVFRQINDHGVNRTKPTPISNVILNNIERFICKWITIKLDDGTDVLSKKVLSEIENLKRHIKKGCLSDIDVGCGTNRDERLHREMNNILKARSIGAELAYVRLTELFMEENRKRSGETLWSTIPEMKTLSAEQMTQDAYEDQTQSHSEQFGIRSKSNEMESTEVHENIDKIGQFNIQNLCDLQYYIEKRMEDDSRTKDRDNGKMQFFLEIIKQALAWWSTSLCIQSIVGARCVKKGDIPSVVRSRMNCKNISKHSKSRQATDTEMAELITSFGYSAVDIPADGDCLFTSIAFQLLQLINEPNGCSRALKAHLDCLGIDVENANIPSIAEKLRCLVVNEWQGQFCEEYMEFFSPSVECDADPKVMFMQEAEKFRKKGVFAVSLGDAAPLALSNILHLPIMVLTTNNTRAFTEICPRFLITSAKPILLAHYTDGPGHYNALVRNEVGTITPEQQTTVTPSKKGKKKTTPNEKQSRKRKRHEFQTFSPRKTKDFLLSKNEDVKEGPINLAEHFLLRAIMNEQLVKIPGKEFQSTVASLYNDVVNFMKDDSTLKRIPVNTHKETKLKKSIRRILKEDDKIDTISN